MPSFVEVGPQILPCPIQIECAPCGIVRNLIFANPRNAEIFGLGVPEIKSADRCGRQHGKAFGQRDAGFMGRIQQVEQYRLQAVVRTGGIARCWPDAAIFLTVQRLGRELLVGRITP